MVSYASNYRTGSLSYKNGHSHKESSRKNNISSNKSSRHSEHGSYGYKMHRSVANGKIAVFAQYKPNREHKMFSAIEVFDYYDNKAKAYRLPLFWEELECIVYIVDQRFRQDYGRALVEDRIITYNDIIIPALREELKNRARKSIRNNKKHVYNDKNLIGCSFLENAFK